jgi:hypothetical protein
VFLAAFLAKYPRFHAAWKLEGLADVADPKAKRRSSIELGTFIADHAEIKRGKDF